MPQAAPRDTLIRLQPKGQMVIPLTLRRKARVSDGSLMRVTVVKDGQFLLTAQLPEKEEPIVIPKTRKAALRMLGQVVAEIRQEAKEKGLDKLTPAQIQEAVADTRRRLKKNGAR